MSNTDMHLVRLGYSCCGQPAAARYLQLRKRQVEFSRHRVLHWAVRTQLQHPARAVEDRGRSLEGSSDAIACSALLQKQCRCICFFCGGQAARSGSFTADRSALSSRECYTPVLNRLGRAADVGRRARLMRARTSRVPMQRSKKRIPGAYILTQHLESLEVIKAVLRPPQQAGSTYSAASSANTSLTSLSKQLFWNIT
jgi:hypothetical protein